MRLTFAALLLTWGLIGLADTALASVYGPSRIYVPGHIRDGVYIRPHFVSTPKLGYGAWPTQPGAIEPKPQPPVIEPMPLEDHKLGEPS